MRYLLVFLTVLASISGAVAQSGIPTAPRTVQLAPSFPDPVKIVRVTLDGVEIKPGLQAYPADKPGVPFEAADDWLNHLTVVLKNTSAKRVVYADIRVFFLGTEDKTPLHSQLVDANQVGERPKHARYSTIRGAWQNDPARDAILIESGHEFSLPAIDPERFDEVKQAIETRQPLSSVTAIRLDVATVYFEDGTKWGGGYFRPDFSAPGRYIHISQKEFDAYRQETSQ
jgi:hypothetical protein